MHGVESFSFLLKTGVFRVDNPVENKLLLNRFIHTLPIVHKMHIFSTVRLHKKWKEYR